MTVRLRWIVIQSVVASLLLAGAWSWKMIHPASFGDNAITAAILVLPMLGLRLIIGVGGALMDDETMRNRKTGADGHRL